jgi:pimeloyl-ACP methyl ester carboxylesterase
MHPFPSGLLRLLALVTALVCAGAAQGQDRACRPVVPDAASAVPLRIPELRYTCARLRSGQRVLVGEAGDASAPPVLLVHGLGQQAHRDWQPAIPSLAKRFHVVAIDLPGFGSSEASPSGYSFEAFAGVLNEVMDQRAAGQRAHVVGHSLGGAVSLFFAHRHPERVDRLVLVDAAGLLFKSVFVQHVTRVNTGRVGIAPIDRILRGIDDRLNRFSRSVFNEVDSRYDIGPWLVRNPSVRNALLGRYTQVDAAMGLVEHDFTAAVRETQAPTTVIWGRDDPVAPLRTGTMLALRMPDARLRVMDRVGHTPMEDDPYRFSQWLLEALTQPLPPRPAGVPDASLPSQGDVACRGATGRRYSGRFDSLTLENCEGAEIADARLGRLVLVDSSATLDNAVVDSDGVAVTAERSRLVATGVRLRGRVALRVDDSQIDLAGASLKARERAVEMPKASWVYFSVSDIQAPDYAGDAHMLWAPAAPASAPAPVPAKP